ncbi:hypothetical protein [Pedobacter sp. Hv1]|uniref:DUF6929 family protein n=1 Tax=Pedobacter sp. Hv1 TaxID=1740090 RepID=UPI0006D8AC73|nr:hypothetical protein [Pedobacter sp. Hv1]KQB99771.1 hypothetical protein AQF98_14715 [Pedobacter sp. Hv1]
MYKNELEVFAKIKGVGSASGLFLYQNLLYIIGDNSGYLYEYHIASEKLNRIQILPKQSQLENIPKKDKPDFEVLCNYNNVLYILSSGSAANRNLIVEYRLKTKEIIRHDLSKLYRRIKEVASIDDANLNIEGAIFTGNEWFLFNRGNGNTAKNGIVKIAGNNLTAENKIEFFAIVLQKTNHVIASFTDAILYKDQIYFIAAAEDTTSTFDDGEIQGSYIGSIDRKTLSLNYTKKISDDQKFEGISFFKQHEDKIEFLLCEDRDTQLLETIIYKLLV